MRTDLEQKGLAAGSAWQEEHWIKNVGVSRPSVAVLHVGLSQFAFGAQLGSIQRQQSSDW